MWEKLKYLRSKYISLNLNDTIGYEKFTMMSLVYNSSKIEGCSLSKIDTNILLEHGLTAKGKPLYDHLMVRDLYEAYKYIKFEALNKRKLSIDFIKSIAEKTMKSTGAIINTNNGSYDISKGDLRKGEVYVGKKCFPAFSKVEELLNQMIDDINSRLDTVTGHEILKLSADIHYVFVNIHPFGDGNGRISRLLMNYIQFYHDEPMIEIFNKDRVEYINSLNKAEEVAEISVFRNFICKQHIKFLEMEIEKFEKMKNE